MSQDRVTVPEPECKPAEVYPPSAFIRKEMEEREWSVDDLATRGGWPAESVAVLLFSDHWPLTRGGAYFLERAFGASKEYWINLGEQWVKALRDPDYELVLRKRGKP